MLAVPFVSLSDTEALQMFTNSGSSDKRLYTSQKRKTKFEANITTTIRRAVPQVHLLHIQNHRILPQGSLVSLPVFYIKTQSVPRSKHCVSVVKTNMLMLSSKLEVRENRETE
jgi:hypothetical protein